MAINYELLNKGGISLGTNFELLSEKPLDSRLVVPSLEGLQNYIDNAAAYEGLIAYVSSEKKHYEVKVIDGVLSYRPFGLTEAELNDLITNATTAAMEFKGATATLPENPSKGDMYKVAGENINIKIDDVDAQLGDSIVYDGEKWFLIPSGDDIEDTWRPVDGVNNDATLKFVDGDKTVAAVAADGTIKYNHATVAAPADVTVEGDEKTRTYITAVETDGYGHITGYKTATENVEDTNTEYTFESQVESSFVYFNVTPNTEGAAEETIYVDAYSKNEADGKFVAQETGKSLISDDEIARLAEVDNYNDEEVRGLIGDNAQAIEDLETYVGTIPTDDKYKDLSVVAYINKKAEETLAAAQGGSSETAASVKQQLDNYKSENDTRVKAIEDDVAAIKDTENGILKQAQNYADGLAANYDEAGAAAGVQTALETEIAKKVAKTDYEADKATFATKADIEKLAGVSEGANKVEASETNGNIKIDGVETVVYTHKDKHTISEVDGLQDALDAKVAKADYDVDKATFATKTELGNVDKKFENYTTTTDQQAIDAEQNRRLGVIEGDYVKAADIADFETKGNVANVAEDLAAETKARTDADAGFETRIAALEGNFGDGEGTVEAQIAAAVKAEEDARKEAVAGVQGEVDAVEGRMDTAEGKIATLEGEATKHAIKTEVEGALALKADKSVVDAMYTNGQIDTAVQGAKDYAKGLVDAIPAQTDYSVTITENTDDNTVAKTYVFSQCGAEIGSIKLAKELVVTSGSVKEVAEDGKPYADAKTGDKYIELVIANQDAPIYVPAKDLVDIYTAKDGATEVQIAISNINEISATLVNGGITEEKLAEGVKTKLNKTWEEVGVAAGLVEGLENGQVKTNKEAIENITKADGLIATAEQNAKDYTDDEIEKLALGTMSKEAADDYVKKSDATGYGDILTKTEAQGAYQAKGDYAAAEHEHVAADITDFATEVAKVKVSNAVKADEATKAIQDGNGKVIADTYAEKATTLAGYGIGDAYTKTEIEALLTWGSF